MLTFLFLYNTIELQNKERRNLTMEKWHEFKINYPNGFYLKNYKDYNYIVFQHPNSGSLCGFIQLKSIDEVTLESNPINKLDCHGGITYKGNLKLLFNNSKDNYIGFDCSHVGDKNPFIDAMLPDWVINEDEVWRDEAYVEENCQHLIDQLIELQKG